MDTTSFPAGFEPLMSTPAELANQIENEIEMWGKVIRAANVKARRGHDQLYASSAETLNARIGR
jgi:hypothetical protein